MQARAPGDVTRLLQDWGRGNEDALRELTALIYRELRCVAAAHLRRERPNHTLQPTALVHEMYLRFLDKAPSETHNRAHFFAIAANQMRQILVDHARARKAAKRGGGRQVTLKDYAGAGGLLEIDVLALDDSLEMLTKLDARAARVVELRFFAGLTEQEIAAVLGISEITVKRDWRAARAFLYDYLRGASPARPATA